MPAPWMDGNAALRAVLAGSRFGSAEQAVAALSVFTHPDTVAAAGHGPVFRIVRRNEQRDVGRLLPGVDGRPVLHDDNKGPTDLFLWASALPRGGVRDAQFNHVYPRLPPHAHPGAARARGTGPAADDGGQLALYTALSNLCVTPAFLAKLTDTDAGVRALLRYRVFDAYGYAPEGPPPDRPEIPGVAGGYGALTWAPCPAPVPDLEGALRAALRRNAKSRTAYSAREAGWWFSGYAPDPTV